MKAGIQTLADLKARCRVDKDTGCWKWGGARGHAVGAAPSVWLPGKGAVSLTRALHYLLGLEAPTQKALLMPTCGNAGCANPDHRTMGNKGQYLARTPRRPKKQPTPWTGGAATSVFDWRP
jgi:hypothetical protein